MTTQCAIEGARPTTKLYNSRVLKDILIFAIVFSTPISMIPNALAEENTSKWRFEVGPSYRASMDTEVIGSSRSRDAILKATQPSKSIPSLAEGQAKDYPNLDDVNAIGNRDFDDGYVHTDLITPIDLRTENFGFYINSQLDRNNSTLTFHRTTEVSGSELVGKGTEYRKTITTSMDNLIDITEDYAGVGFKMNALYDLPQWKGIKFALFSGIRGFFGMNNAVEASNFAQDIKESTKSYRDIYNYTDNISDTYVFRTANFIPDAPYSDPSIIPNAGPLISNIPSSATRDISHSGFTQRNYGVTHISTWETKNQIAMDVDVDLFQFALGSEVSYDICSKVAINLRPSILINLMNADITRTEDLVAYYKNGETQFLANWSDSQSEEEVLLGAAIEAGLQFKLSESWFAGIEAGYEWIDDSSIEIGPNTVALDLSGFSTSAMIGIRF